MAASNLRGVLPDRAVEAITALDKTVQSVKVQVEAMKAKPVLTPDQAEVRFGAPAMSKALSVSGTNPLNTVALLGNTGFSGSFVVGGVTLVFENGKLQSHNP